MHLKPYVIILSTERADTSKVNFPYLQCNTKWRILVTTCKTAWFTPLEFGNNSTGVWKQFKSGDKIPINEEKHESLTEGDMIPWEAGKGI